MITPLPPDQTTSWPVNTMGICRHINEPFGVSEPLPSVTGGGDLNGTAALILRSHAGTGLAQTNMPMLPRTVGGA
jgi:hypothetical protein